MLLLMDLDESGTIDSDEFTSVTICLKRMEHAKKHPEHKIRSIVDSEPPP